VKTTRPANNANTEDARQELAPENAREAETEEMEEEIFEIKRPLHMKAGQRAARPVPPLQLQRIPVQPEMLARGLGVHAHAAELDVKFRHAEALHAHARASQVCCSVLQCVAVCCMKASDAC